MGKVRMGFGVRRFENHPSIKQLELLAAFFGLKFLGSRKRDYDIFLRIDNTTTAIAYNNRMSETRFERLTISSPAKSICKWCVPEILVVPNWLFQTWTPHSLWRQLSLVARVNGILNSSAAVGSRDRSRFKCEKVLQKSIKIKTGITQKKKKKLFLEMVTLLALTTGHRMQTLASVNVRNIRELKDQLELKIPA
ncbi:hypothetical protein M0804_009099 [Polistes exclamans]|nr:hypothetical protein M0804_009099 [Polistes exclamans]